MKLPRVFAPLIISLVVGCGGEAEHGGHGEVHIGMGRAPAAARSSTGASEGGEIEWPNAAPELPTPPEPRPLTPAENQELDERKQALADVGSQAFEALRTGNMDALIELTPASESSQLASQCPGMVSYGRKEMQARFDHCQRSIDWSSVAKADVFTGELVAAQARGCEQGISDYGRLQLFVHMNDGTIWRVDFLGAVGREGKTLGINGAVTCRTVESAPQPR